jgi:hypothetical protein
MSRPFYCPGSNPQCPLHRRICDPQIQSGRLSCTCSGSNLDSSAVQLADSLDTVSTELLQVTAPRVHSDHQLPRTAPSSHSQNDPLVRERTGEGVATFAISSNCLISDTGNLKSSAITYINLNYYTRPIINYRCVINNVITVCSTINHYSVIKNGQE